MYNNSNYDLIIQCFLSGQMSESAFFCLMQMDQVFNKYVQKEFTRRRKEQEYVY